MPKIIRSYIKLFENSETYNVLKVTSQALSFVVSILTYILTNSGDIAFASFFISVLGVDLIFFILRKRESQFKSALFFEKNKTTPKIMNRYFNFMLSIRVCLMTLALYPVITSTKFSPGHLSNVMIFYAIITFICIAVMGHVVKYNPRIGQRREDNSRFPPGVWGVPGYNSLGVYTGSPTAIGGMCD